MGPVEYESANFMSFYHPQKSCFFLKTKFLPVECHSSVKLQFEGSQVTFRTLHVRPRQKPQCAESWDLLFF